MSSSPLVVIGWAILIYTWLLLAPIIRDTFLERTERDDEDAGDG